MYTGQNLNIDYTKLRNEQINDRNKQNQRHNDNIKKYDKHTPSVGDVVIIPEQHNKHKSRDNFIVTKVKDEHVSMQKIIHPFDRQNTNITSKTYQTKLDRPTVIRRANNPITETELKKKETKQWNPIRIQDYIQDSDEDLVKISIPVTSQTTITTSTAPTTTDSSNRSHYHELQEWIALQSKTAEKQLSSGGNAIQSYIPPPPPLPPPPLPKTVHQKSSNPSHRHQPPNTNTIDVEDTNSTDKRKLQKKITKQKISKYYNRPILQVDGHYTENDTEQSSKDTSPEHSSKETSPVQITTMKTRNKSSTNAAFCDENNFDKDSASNQSDPQSLQWDTLCDENDLIFFDTEPDLNKSFYYKYQQSPDRTTPIASNRVYKFHNLLDSLPKETIQSPIQKKRQRQKTYLTKIVSKCKKLKDQ